MAKNSGGAACKGLPVLLPPPEERGFLGGGLPGAVIPRRSKYKEWLYNFEKHIICHLRRLFS